MGGDVLGGMHPRDPPYLAQRSEQAHVNRRDHLLGTAADLGVLIRRRLPQGGEGRLADRLQAPAGGLALGELIAAELGAQPPDLRRGGRATQGATASFVRRQPGSGGAEAAKKAVAAPASSGWRRH